MSKLYVTPLVGLVTVMVPVAVAHVGCATEVVGTEGVMGWALIIVAADYAHVYPDISKPYEPVVKYPVSRNICCLSSTNNIFVYVDVLENKDVKNLETVKYDIIKIVNLTTDIKLLMIFAFCNYC